MELFYQSADRTLMAVGVKADAKFAAGAPKSQLLPQQPGLPMTAYSGDPGDGYTRPGNPDDKFNADGTLIRQVGFESETLMKFKIMGGTVYFAVFKNTSLVEGDTFGTGMAYDHADAAGFIRLFGLPERVRALTRERLGEKADLTVDATPPASRTAKR